MFTYHESGCLIPRLWKRHAAVPRFKHFQPLQLMPVVVRKHFFGRHTLAKIMHKSSKTHHFRWYFRCHLIHDIHYMLKGVTLGMKLNGLSFSYERMKLRKNFGKKPRFLKRAEKYRRVLSAKSPHHLIKDSLCRLVSDFLTAGTHCLICLGGDGKAKLCRLACRTQRTHRILPKML